VTKLLIILSLGGALANGAASVQRQPPLLIQDTTAHPLDAANQ
jgi:hypothetical protein